MFGDESLAKVVCCARYHDEAGLAHDPRPRLLDVLVKLRLTTLTHSRVSSCAGHGQGFFSQLPFPCPSSRVETEIQLTTSSNQSHSHSSRAYRHHVGSQQKGRGKLPDSLQSEVCLHTNDKPRVVHSPVWLTLQQVLVRMGSTPTNIFLKISFKKVDQTFLFFLSLLYFF